LSLSRDTVAYIYERDTGYLVAASSFSVALTRFNVTTSVYDRVHVLESNDSTIQHTATGRDGSFGGYLVEVENVDDVGIKWSIVLAIRESSIYHSSRHQSGVAFAAAAIIVIFAVGITMAMIFWTIVRPLNLLCQKMVKGEKYTAGTGLLSSEVGNVIDIIGARDNM
jgi:hypothetical protein